MAKKATEETALATKSETALARPSFIPAGNEGTEHIGREDVKLPRISLAQKMSPELEDSHDRYIEGLREGNFFNDLTKEILPETLKFVIIKSDRPRFIEFRPRSEGGGILDMNVQANDPRTLFTTDDAGKSVPPKATKFYDYVVVLLDDIETPIALSLKGTSIKTAKELNGFIKMRKAPLYSGIYELSSATEKNAKGAFKIFKVKNAGFIQDEPTFKLMKNAYEMFAGKVVEFNREHPDVDATSDANESGAGGGTDFNPADM